ncbi:aldehyde dehydrogenase family protein, partial [Mycobacterium avium]|uniref:aldehyde dehydrogenase family protein n=1 Tax=Mycobacterium avium TaxID=1764 RepID=UPI0012DA8661
MTISLGGAARRGCVARRAAPGPRYHPRPICGLLGRVSSKSGRGRRTGWLSCRPTRTERTDTAVPGTPQEIVVTCPATGQVVGRVPVAGPAAVEAVAARLRAAQPRWQQMGVGGRDRWLGKWRDWML